MDFNQIYSFLFESYAGMGVLIAAGLVLSLIVSVVLEVKTRKRYVNHEVDPEQDEWAIFEEDVARGFAIETEELEKEKLEKERADKADTANKVDKAGNN